MFLEKTPPRLWPPRVGGTTGSLVARPHLQAAWRRPWESPAAHPGGGGTGNPVPPRPHRENTATQGRWCGAGTACDPQVGTVRVGVRAPPSPCGYTRTGSSAAACWGGWVRGTCSRKRQRAPGRWSPHRSILGDRRPREAAAVGGSVGCPGTSRVAPVCPAAPLPGPAPGDGLCCSLPFPQCLCHDEAPVLKTRVRRAALRRDLQSRRNR